LLLPLLLLLLLSWPNSFALVEAEHGRLEKRASGIFSVSVDGPDVGAAAPVARTGVPTAGSAVGANGSTEPPADADAKRQELAVVAGQGGAGQGGHRLVRA